MPNQQRCVHPKNQRTPAADDRMLCGKCGNLFLPRGAATRHGTYRGYVRHVAAKAKKGEWGWPLKPLDAGGCGCKEAATEWRRQEQQRPSSRESALRRGRARLQALHRLKRAFPGVYSQFYREEIQQAGGAYRAPRGSLWDDVIARIVKEALGKDEAAVADRIRLRTADYREREVMRQVARLRIMIENMEGTK